MVGDAFSLRTARSVDMLKRALPSGAFRFLGKLFINVDLIEGFHETHGQ